MARDSALTESPASWNIGGVGRLGPTSQAPEDAALGPNAGPLLLGPAGPEADGPPPEPWPPPLCPPPPSCAIAAALTASATARTSVAIQNFATLAKVVARTEASSSNASAA